MIIIATNNGHLYLEKLLFDFENFFINKEICLIDTGSTDEESLKFLDKIKNKKTQIIDMKRQLHFIKI